MAAVWNSNYGTSPSLIATTGGLNSQLTVTARAQAFAWFDYLKGELPDVFYIQNDPNFPINFAFPANGGYPGSANPLMSPNGPYANYMLPLGNSIFNGPYNGSLNGPYGDGNLTAPTYGFSGSGIFGASYPIAAGLFKNLPGISQIGWDAVDNNGNNLVDEIGEGGWNLQLLQTNHQHVTARSEMLYAILVEGTGPWGSVFSRDDFTDREVMDTDKDGLPEFVDAWGQPLQFFRWPVLYHSDVQRGQMILPDPVAVNTFDLLPPYQTFDSSANGVSGMGGVFQEREQLSAGPQPAIDIAAVVVCERSQRPVGGQQPVAVCRALGAGQRTGASGGVQAFEFFFHRLVEPLPFGSGAGPGVYWDRSGSFPRRAFYTKFLILSGGRDKQPGVFLYADSDFPQMTGHLSPASYLIANENNAMPFAMDIFGGGIAGFTASDVFGSATPQFTNTSSYDPTHPSSYDLRESAKDDISNHNLQAVSGIGGSG